jgi:hypothetical protein
MAVVAGVNVGVGAVRDANDAYLAYPRLGVSASITIAAASVAIQLPVDANGRLYPAYAVNANGLAWVNINTVGDAAVAGAANTYLINASGLQVVIPTPANMVAGATAQISVIMDSGGAGKVCVVGIL